MYSNNDKYEIILRSASDVNMSNWQITKTLDTMTMVNNKFSILSTINKMISEGIDKKDIFVTDKSFLISTNYKTYFNKGNIFKGDEYGVIKMYSLGRLISMEPNEDIFKINCLFEMYKKLNSITNKHLKCRIRNIYLSKAFSTLFSENLDAAYEVLTEGTKNQINNIFERHLSPDYTRLRKIINEVEKKAKVCGNQNKIKYEKKMYNTKKTFEYTFNRFDRPVVGIYNRDNHSIEIINSDQMYKNGEESEKQIKLNRITKNSPVLIALLVTGPMVGFLGYLLYRDHKVNTQLEAENMLDIPKSNEEAIGNILSPNNNGLIDIGQEKAVDSHVIELAKNNLNKLEMVTNKKNVHMEMNIEEEIE